MNNNDQREHIVSSCSVYGRNSHADTSESKLLPPEQLDNLILERVFKE